VLPALPAKGAYTLLINPPAATSVSVQALLSQALSGTITVGQQITFNSQRLGQGGIYTFVAPASGAATVSLTGCTNSSGISAMIVDPTGNSVVSISAFPGSDSSYSLTGLVSGTYKIAISPDGPATGQVTVGVK